MTYSDYVFNQHVKSHHCAGDAAPDHEISDRGHVHHQASTPEFLPLSILELSAVEIC